MPSPLVSGIASLLVPGLGQLLNRKYLRGGVLLGLWLFVSAVVMIAALGLVVITHAVFIIASAIDAYRIAQSGLA